MKKELRRKDRALPKDETRLVLAECEYGVLAATDENGAPYAVPLSYVVLDNAVYFHCALEGRKIDCLRASPAVCFTVVRNTQPVYDGGFSTYYESCVAEGAAREVTDEQEKREALMALAEKYLPEHMDKAEGDIARLWARTAVWAVDVARATGKAKRKATA